MCEKFDELNDDVNVITGPQVIEHIGNLIKIQNVLRDLDRFDDTESNEFRFSLLKDDYENLISEIVRERISLTPNASIRAKVGAVNPGETEPEVSIVTRNVFCNGILDIHQISPYIYQSYHIEIPY